MEEDCPRLPYKTNWLLTRRSSSWAFCHDDTSGRENTVLFAIICKDRPGALELRKATRAQHLACLESHKASIQFAGPQLDAQGNPSGSLIVLDVPDRESAEGFAAADPYAGVNLFESVVVRPLRAVFRDGQMVA